MTRFDAVSAVSRALLGGRVLQTKDVSVGNGMIVDWRDIRCGETIAAGLDPFDGASLFVELVGTKAAESAVRR